MPTTFPIYSIAKPFLAQAVIELELPLDDTVGDHVAPLSNLYAKRTIGELLNHTSGLSDYSELPEYREAVAKAEQAWSRDELLDRAQILSHDRSGFHYSNIGYLLLRMLVEQQTELSYFDALDQLVFKKLDLNTFEEWESPSQHVPNYDPRWVYSGTFLSAQGSLETAFLKLIQYRAQTIGLSAGLVDVPYPNTGFDHPAYSWGLMNDLGPDKGEPKYVGHGGGGPGFSHMILVNTENWSVAMETSTDEFDQSQAITRLKLATSKSR